MVVFVARTLQSTRCPSPTTVPWKTTVSFTIPPWSFTWIESLAPHNSLIGHRNADFCLPFQTAHDALPVLEAPRQTSTVAPMRRRNLRQTSGRLLPGQCSSFWTRYQLFNDSDNPKLRGFQLQG